MAVVRIPTVLRPQAGGQARVEVEGTTLGEVLRALVAAHPALDERLLDGDRVRGYVNVFVDDEDVRYLGGLDAPVGATSEVTIMPAVAGGAR
ncbi:MAG: Sulfur carrier protein CysO [Actinomycetota bacterium]